MIGSKSNISKKEDFFAEEFDSFFGVDGSLSMMLNVERNRTDPLLNESGTTCKMKDMSIQSTQLEIY